MAEPKTRLELIASTVQVLSVVVGVVLSVFSFNLTRQKEADAALKLAHALKESYNSGPGAE
jgi:hypothetical protein